jgi:hypothetical protein
MPYNEDTDTDVEEQVTKTFSRVPITEVSWSPAGLRQNDELHQAGNHTQALDRLVEKITNGHMFALLERSVDLPMATATYGKLRAIERDRAVVLFKVVPNHLDDAGEVIPDEPVSASVFIAGVMVLTRSRLR